MDEKKDIQKTSLNTLKGQFSPYGVISDIIKDISSGNLDNKSIITKAMRVSEALYIVSDGMSLNDSLRSSIRTNGLAILDKTFSYVLDNNVSLKEECLREYARTSFLVHLATISGYISVSGRDLLYTALTDLQLRLKKAEETISHDFFNEDLPFAEEKRVVHKSRTFQSNVDGLETKVAHSKNEGRRGAIMALLKGSDGVTVKDVLKVVPEVSEKTVQRELLAMVEEGVLRKEGERRWTLYFLHGAA